MPAMGHALPMVVRHDGLAAVVQDQLGFDPHSGLAVIFRSRRGDRTKILFWDGSGLVTVYKRLEQGSFTWPVRHRSRTHGDTMAHCRTA